MPQLEKPLIQTPLPNHFRIPAELMADPNAVFVFGSNDAGRHGKGAALDAKQLYGAKYREARGFTGRCFAIATKDEHMNVHSLMEIAAQVRDLVENISIELHNKKKKFYVTRIGCGLSGYKDYQIAPMFAGAPENMWFDPSWKAFGFKSWADIEIPLAKPEGWDQ